MDGQGRLFIRGRLKNVILGASGENIYPEEIEAVINQSPYVDDSLSTGRGRGGGPRAAEAGRDGRIRDRGAGRVARAEHSLNACWSASGRKRTRK